MDEIGEFSMILLRRAAHLFGNHEFALHMCKCHAKKLIVSQEH